MLFRRYVNMDYIFVNAMRESLVVNKVVSYDIACQWAGGLLERISKFPDHVQIALPKGSIIYAIPKLHWGSHIRLGHSQYSLNYLVGAGRNDGEGIERRWWSIAAAVGITRGMGPGSRQGIYEDLWGYSNWRKIVDLGKSYH